MAISSVDAMLMHAGSNDLDDPVSGRLPWPWSYFGIAYFAADPQQGALVLQIIMKPSLLRCR